MPYSRFIPTHPDYVAARQSQEVDMYDFLVPDVSGPYQERLQSLSNFLDKQVTRDKPGSFETRKRLLENSPELIKGDTNFSKAPYEWFSPKTSLESMTPLIKSGEIKDKNTEGTIWRHNPERVYINPNIPLSGTSTLLAHEGGAHTGSLTLDNRNQQVQAVKTLTGKYASNPRDNFWVPKFTDEFYGDLEVQRVKRNSPYFSATGFGTDTEETMAYLMGREAELPAGKTLKDDPSTAYIFAKHPQMYEEYVKSRDKIRSVYRKKP